MNNQNPNKMSIEKSNIADFDTFKNRLKQDEKYCNFDPVYYYKALTNYSAQGYKYADWYAAARNWMLRDHKEGKATIL